MGMGVADSFKRLVREIIGLPSDPGAPPDIMRLGLYPARVDVCSSDGKTCDVTPDDKRVSRGEKRVKVRAGIPGATAVVTPGAVVLLGWEGGDPKRPYCMPGWGAGATVTKLVLKANQVFIGDEADADALVTKTDFDAHTHPYTNVTAAATTSAPTNPAAGTSKLKAV